jgi:hypothetical protein
MSIGIIAAIFLVVLIGGAFYAVRSARAERLRVSEERRNIDKGKHVEL